jgi:hypothetical protein
MAGQSSLEADAATYRDIDAFMRASSGIYNSEDLRITAIDQHLAKLVGRTFTVYEARGVKSDGVITQCCGKSIAFVAIKEVKNEIGTASSDPYNECGLAYRKYWALNSRK